MTRHSVDSAVSLRSQHHADRIRWPSKARYSQRRSVSELELASRPAQAAPPRTNDLEYLDNPAENLEFNQKRLQHPPRPRPRPEDEYYRHLTARVQDRWWHGSQGILQAPAALQAALPLPGLRRSRSLAVIREEVCSGPLIPRARLSDKPVYKDRFLQRPKFQTKEEALEKIYNKSTSSCYGDVSDNPNHGSDELILTNEGIYEEANSQGYADDNKGQPNGWNGTEAHPNGRYIEENVYSRNPSEIDSLDSNYIHKNYNFENNGIYRESSPDTIGNNNSESQNSKGKLLFIRSAQTNSEEDYYLRDYNEGQKSESDQSSSGASKTVTKSQTNFHVLEQSNSEYNELESSDSLSSRRSVKQKGQTNGLVNGEKGSDTSESESTKSVERVTTQLDKDNISVTSYVSVPYSSPGNPPRRLENLAFSLAEKIDEYCDSKYKENFVEIPLHLHSAGNSFNSKSFDDLNSIYTQVNKIKTGEAKAESKYKGTLERYQKNYHATENQLYKQYNEKFKPHHIDLKTRSLYRQSSSSKNITTEPFVTTLIENQYYSLPDINISKSLRRSEQIDAKLRKSEEENNAKNTNTNCEPQTAQQLPDKNQEVEGDIKAKVEEETNGDSLISITQKDRNTDEEIIHEAQKDAQAKNEANHSKSDEAPKSGLANNPQLQSHQTSVVTVDGVIIEVENKFSNHPLTVLASKGEEKKSVFAHIPKEKSDCNNRIIKDLPVIPIKREILKQIKKEDISSHPTNLTNTRSFTEKDLVIAKSQLNSTNRGRTSITKHYSLRQRDPKTDKTPQLPAPPIEESVESKETKPIQSNNKSYTKGPNKSLSSTIYDVVCRENKQIQRIHSFKSRDLRKHTNDENNITIVPLSGHQTIVVDAPITRNSTYVKSVPKISEARVQNLSRDSENSNKENCTYSESDPKDFSDISSEHSDENKNRSLEEHYHSDGEIERPPQKQIVLPRVKKERSFKIAAVQNKFEKPPPKLIIKDTRNIARRTEMSRPQVIRIKDNRKPEKLKLNGTHSTSSESETHENGLNNGIQPSKPHIYNVTEKVDKAVRTDIEYQEKLHSVKNYWSKLIDKSSDENETEDSSEATECNMRECLPEEPINANQPASVENIIKSIETVKIVDSIKKNPGESDIIDVWKKMDGAEKEKAESVIEEATLEKIVYDKEPESADNSIKAQPEMIANEKDNEDYKSFSPDIEIVELKNNDCPNSEDVTHATLIKPKSFQKDCAEFDHVRYKVMNPDLFKKSIIANYKKEAQFDGLLQYLQDYSFQELLVNNNIVIIEPVRTKIESSPSFNSETKRPSSCRITGATVKPGNEETDNKVKQRKGKQGIKRHFFYHPIRVNKEVIEEELPNPDTVKTVRNLFERTLTMRRPGESSNASIERDSDISKRSGSHKNLSDDSKLEKSNRKKRYLTIDTSYGQRKWDSASLSSGVSSGDLSSNNEHDYDTDALAKENNENIYCSSSEEYLCESLNPSLCYESQYVSQDILEKIRECGTSITYYGGKVLDERCGPAVSPMTKQIMEEIRGLQRNCCRDCDSCQTRCTGGKCDCLYGTDTFSRSETASVIDEDRMSKCCACSEIMEKNDRQKQDTLKKHATCDNYLGFKFKLVKSNSCSSRLELAGAGEENSRRKFTQHKMKDEEDPSIIYDKENSVKTKICRIESYRKGIAKSPFNDKDAGDRCDITINNQIHNLENRQKSADSPDKLNSKNVTVNNHRTLASVDESAADKIKMPRNKNVDLAYAVNAHVNGRSASSDKCDSEESKADQESPDSLDDNESNANSVVVLSSDSNEHIITSEQKTVAETIKCFSEPTMYEKKFYYINGENDINPDKKGGKFGEMVFEEFEVLESASDRIKNAHLDKK